jgi:hypothetical protein
MKFLLATLFNRLPQINQGFQYHAVLSVILLLGMRCYESQRSDEDGICSGVCSWHS